MSIGNLLKMEMSSLVFVRSCCQLFEEAFAFNSSLLDFLVLEDSISCIYFKMN